MEMDSSLVVVVKQQQQQQQVFLVRARASVLVASTIYLQRTRPERVFHQNGSTRVWLCKGPGTDLSRRRNESNVSIGDGWEREPTPASSRMLPSRHQVIPRIENVR